MKNVLPVGQRRHLVTLQGPVTTVSDGQGGYTQTPAALDPPTWYCAIRPASQRELERTTAGTTLTTATHIVEGAYRSDIKTSTQIVFNGRTLFVNSVVNPEERNISLVLLCNEVVT